MARQFLQVCMHCDWIYKGELSDCPKCSWPAYRAKSVFGNKAYKYAKTQQPWMEKQINKFGHMLEKEIESDNCITSYQQTWIRIKDSLDTLLTVESPLSKTQVDSLFTHIDEFTEKVDQLITKKRRNKNYESQR